MSEWPPEKLVEIASFHGATLVYVDDAYIQSTGMDPENFENRSYIAGGEIVLGRYQDRDLLLASFFHELGHKADPRQHATYYESERGAWEVGFALASFYGFEIQNHAVKWAEEQLGTYDKPEYR